MNLEFSYASSNPLYHIKNLYLNNKLVTSLTVPEGVAIKKYAFSYCTNITSVTIPESVKFMSTYVFRNCAKLRNITFENTTGWKIYDSSDFTTGSDIDLSSPLVNAFKLRSNKYMKV